MHSPSEPSDAWLTPETRSQLRAVAERDVGEFDAAPADRARGRAPSRDHSGDGAAGDGASDDGADFAGVADDELARLSRRVCGDVRARGGSAVDLVLALKELWGELAHTDSRQRRRSNERLSRLITLSIDAFYAAQRDDGRGAPGGQRAQVEG